MAESDIHNGVVTVPSRFTVEETVANLQRILIAKGIKLFAIIDHSGEAAAAGLAMPPTKLLVFGNPKGGTPLMVASPSIAIDLPMKLLIWEDVMGSVWISYNAPAYLAARHGLASESSPVLSAVGSRLRAGVGYTAIVNLEMQRSPEGRERTLVLNTKAIVRAGRPRLVLLAVSHVTDAHRSEALRIDAETLRLVDKRKGEFVGASAS